MAFSVRNDYWSPGTNIGVFDAMMAVLPLDSLVMLTSQDHKSPFEKQSWLRHAPRLPLLQRVRLASSAARVFLEMLLEDNGGRESPLLPSLTELVLVYTALSERRTLRLCDALMKRVEQGVPLETLDLRTCLATSRAVELLSEIVVVVHDSSGVEDYDEDDPDTGSDEVWDYWKIDDLTI